MTGPHVGDRGSVLDTGTDCFFFPTASKPDLCPTQPSVQWAWGALSMEMSDRGDAQGMNVWSDISTSSYFFMVWYMVLTK